mmetsp:Transcript_15123/g.20871  ORF Transcript_15123/g.20871 Transcript_15123/m.20871 type:complete len:253 (+) Transcript_15123:417-1175(+)
MCAENMCTNCRPSLCSRNEDMKPIAHCLHPQMTPLFWQLESFERLARRSCGLELPHGHGAIPIGRPHGCWRMGSQIVSIIRRLTLERLRVGRLLRLVLVDIDTLGRKVVSIRCVPIERPLGPLPLGFTERNCFCRLAWEFSAICCSRVQWHRGRNGFWGAAPVLGGLPRRVLRLKSRNTCFVSEWDEGPGAVASLWRQRPFWIVLSVEGVVVKRQLAFRQLTPLIMFLCCPFIMYICSFINHAARHGRASMN